MGAVKRTHPDARKERQRKKETKKKICLLHTICGHDCFNKWIDRMFEQYFAEREREILYGTLRYDKMHRVIEPVGVSGKDAHTIIIDEEVFATLKKHTKEAEDE